MSSSGGEPVDTGIVYRALVTPEVLSEVVAGRAPAVLPLSVEQLHRMLSLGILAEGEPVELIDGVLVRKNRADTGQGEDMHGPRHAYGVACLARLDRRFELHGFHIRTQLPLTLSKVDEPEPDGAIVQGVLQDYSAGHPTAAQTAVVIEVSDSSLQYDRTTKQRLYATAGIALYVIVDLQAERLELFERPLRDEGRYADTRLLERGATLAVKVAGGAVDIPVTDLLPAS